MLRQIALMVAAAVAAANIAGAAIWPEEFFGYTRESVETVTPGDGAVWEEYGFEEGEKARYVLDGKEFQATAFRFADATSAMAVYMWKLPPRAEPTEHTELSVEWDGGAFLAHGNYVFRFDGYKPTVEQVVGQLLIVPMLEQSPLPTWTEFVPPDGVVPGTARFALGPEGLEVFEPRIPPSVAGFHYSPEAQIGDYESPAGPVKMTVFNYPTPHIARERLAEFRMLDGALVKRTGSMIAVIFDPPDENEAQKLLARVNYRANITWDEYSFRKEPTLVEIVLTAFLFLGGLFLLAVIFGALFGGMKFLRWKNDEAPEDAMVMLHIDDK